MNVRRVWLALAAAAAALPALGAGCGSQPPRTSARVDLWNQSDPPQPPRPASVHLWWLDDFGFLFSDRPFAIPPGTGDYLGNVLVGAYAADAGPRRAIARGVLDSGDVVSEGWANGVESASEPQKPMEVKLKALPAGMPDPYDSDQDGVPDEVDNCPNKPNPDQKNGPC
jgi:hypothetical protein